MWFTMVQWEFSLDGEFVFAIIVFCCLFQWPEFVTGLSRGCRETGWTPGWIETKKTLLQKKVKHKHSGLKATTETLGITMRPKTEIETSKQRHYETAIKTTNRQETSERLAQYIGGKQVYGMRQSGRQEWLRAGEGN